jgi:hypothetical protein
MSPETRPNGDPCGRAGDETEARLKRRIVSFRFEAVWGSSAPPRRTILRPL